MGPTAVPARPPESALRGGNFGGNWQEPKRSCPRHAPLVLVRPGELRRAEWSEFDLDKGEWRIPGERMKMREQHFVPLSRQAVEILRELEPRTNCAIASKPEAARYVFPGAQSRERSRRGRGAFGTRW